MLKTVRIFHYERERGEYSFRDYPATVAKEERIGAKKSGDCRKSAVSIRIFTLKDIGVKTGDYAAVDERSESPNKDRALKVTRVSDNRRGIAPHWRLETGNEEWR